LILVESHWKKPNVGFHRDIRLKDVFHDSALQPPAPDATPVCEIQSFTDYEEIDPLIKGLDAVACADDTITATRLVSRKDAKVSGFKF